MVGASLMLPAATYAARLALVIGNQNYANLPALQTSDADATAYAQVFHDKGFDVISHNDLTIGGMDDALDQFTSRLRPGDTAVFVYSGHGWSDGAQNYIVGIDAPKEFSPSTLKRLSLPIRNGDDGIVDVINKTGASLTVTIIDACRDNPFDVPTLSRSLTLERGFSRTDNVPKGTFMVFSADVGQTALDRLTTGDTNPNGVFTREFLPLLRQNITLLDATKAVQLAVSTDAASVNHEQEPAYYDKTVGNSICFSDKCGSAADAVPQRSADEQMWQSIVHSTDPADFDSFARLFRDSPHVPEATAKAAALRQPHSGGSPDEIAWEQIVNSVDPANFDYFAQQYSFSPHAAEARSRAAALRQRNTIVVANLPPPGATDSKQVRKLQTGLAALGCYVGEPSGVWDSDTVDALSRFATATGRNIDIGGSIGATLTAIRGALPHSCAAVCPAGQAAVNNRCTDQTASHAVPVTVASVRLGAQLMDVNQDIADSIGLGAPRGALITDVTAGSPGARGGLRAGDVVTAVNGLSINGADELNTFVTASPLISTGTVTYWRDNGSHAAEVTFGSVPQPSPKPTQTPKPTPKATPKPRTPSTPAANCKTIGGQRFCG